MLKTIKQKIDAINSSKYGWIYDWILIIGVSFLIRSTNTILLFLKFDKVPDDLIMPFILIFILFYNHITKIPLFSFLGSRFNLLNSIEWLIIVSVVFIIIIFGAAYFTGAHLKSSYITKSNIPMIIIILFNAFAEESYHRGFAYNIFNKRSKWKLGIGKFSVNYAVIATSITFMLDHVVFYDIASILYKLPFQALFGFIMGIQRERTGNILSSTIFHAIINYCAITITITITIPG